MWQCRKDIPTVDNNGNVVEFSEDNATESFNFKAIITGWTENNGSKETKIMVPLKYLNNFWRTLQMPLTNCQIKLILIWSKNCVIVYIDVANQGATFPITETTLYVPVVTLSTQVLKQ